MAWSSTTPAVATKIKDGPGILQANWDVIEDWTANSQHYGITNSLSGHHKPGVCGLFFIGTTGNFPGSNVACAAGFDTTLGVFKYNSGSAWTNIGGLIASGTIMLFYQDTAPTGWTIDNTKDDKVVFITQGAGGQTGGGAHSTGTWTRTGHTHTVATHNHGGVTGSYAANSYYVCGYFEYIRYGTYAHTHTVPGQELTSDANTTLATWRPAAYCVIQCTKD